MKLISISPLLIIVFFAGIQCSKTQEVKEENVARIIKTLSADDMKGRDAFSSDIEMAANFISSEFKQIGLTPLDGSDDFRQPFTIYSTKCNEHNVHLDNKKLDSQLYFARTFTDEINWNEKNSTHQNILKDDNLRQKMREFITDSVSSVIFIDESHHEWFNRYRRFFSRPNYSFQPQNEQTDIFILNSSLAFDSYQIDYKNQVDTLQLYNIAGKIEGKRKDEIVLFSAHYDHIGIMTPVNGDSIANGANDNASGVAGIIEIARHYKMQGKPERTLYFVAFTAEESGGYGSQYFASHIEPNSVVAMFNLEMIGKPAVENPNSAWITGFDYSDLGTILQNSIDSSEFTFYADPYPNQNLFHRSDNAALARLGVPAHSISTTPIDIDENYHRVTDEFHTLNLKHTTNTISAIAKASQPIVSGHETPIRINPDEF